MQRNSSRSAADLSGDNGNGAELADRAGVAENNPVQQAPFNIRQRNAHEHLPAVGAQNASRHFFVRALRLHDRNQFLGNKGHRYKRRRNDNAGNGENNLDVPGVEQVAQKRPCPKHEHEQHTGNNRRDGKRKVDNRNENSLAGEIEFCYAPRRRDSKQNVKRHGNQRRQKRQSNGGKRVRFDQSRPVHFPPGVKRVSEYENQRQNQEQKQESQRQKRQQIPNPARFRRAFQTAFQRAFVFRRLLSFRQRSFSGRCQRLGFRFRYSAKRDVAFIVIYSAHRINSPRPCSGIPTAESY